MFLDPRQRDYAIRTVYGEDPTLSAEAVAHVIRNRTLAGRYGGKDVQGVVLAKNQFEPWNNPKARARMESLNPDSDEYRRIGDITDRVFSGDVPDPTNGATHFYAPKAQAALGRAAPKWDNGQGQQIGPHVFFAPEGRVHRPGDAEGPPAAPMQSAFAGEKRPMDPIAYAMQQNQQQPILSAQSTMGQGALNTGFNPSQSDWGGLVRRNPETDMGNALERAAMHARDAGTGALGALASMKKSDEGHWRLVPGADGQSYRINMKTGQTQAVGPRGPSHAEKAYDTHAQKEFVEQNSKIMAASDAARTRWTALTEAEELTKNPNVAQGAHGPLTLMGKKWAQSFGYDMAGVPESELLVSAANRSAMEARNPANGAGLTGATSDRDLTFLQNSTFSLSNTPETNQRMIRVLKQVEEHKMEVENFRQQYVANNGGRMDGGFAPALKKWSDAKRERLNAAAEAEEAARAPVAGQAPAQRSPLNSFIK
jgi:hypothetical protein